jgi:hypothetical protein
MILLAEYGLSAPNIKRRAEVSDDPGSAKSSMKNTHEESSLSNVISSTVVKAHVFSLTKKEKQRFEQQIDRSGGSSACWPWTGGRNKDGYGRFHGKPKQLAHRVVYNESVGPVPDGICVLHSCDNPPCCNPRHLFLGTLLDNNRDAVRKGRNAKGDKSGSHLHPECRATGLRHGSVTHPERVVRGERHGMVKITPNAVLDIRSTYVPYKNPLRVFAERYGITESQVRNIVVGKSWKYLK